ncbi:hypothetical protein PC113_g1009 [Phytophthora cactorum]|uniref:3-dehydrosphinganine reductase n=1 Tax=Phytophthora cactorum TaxID=29920 RepID=A0A8T1A2E6_9STRA|nr:hypothetical protein PC113_g1009 [Phytophthora cactorum]
MDLWTVLSAVAGCSLLSFVAKKVRAPGFHVDGKHVFITGGSSGIGLATAKKYAQAGAKVSIIARDAKKLEGAKQEIEAVRKHADAAVFTQSCDVVDFEAVKKAVEAANAFHKRATDHVVCSAGIVEPGYFMEQDVAGFRHSMDINYFGCLHVVHAALPAMIRQHEAEGGSDGGQITLVGSAFSLMACIGSAQYSSSKYAVRGLAESLRNELKLYDIRVSAFYPGNVDTPMLEHELALTPPETKTIEGTLAALVRAVVVAQVVKTHTFEGCNSVARRRHGYIARITLLDELPDLPYDASNDTSSSLHVYFRGCWGLLFSHPDDFTPICTTELGEVARLENAGEFARRGVKLLALSCNDVASHKRWVFDIEQFSGAKVNYPIVADPSRRIAAQLGMLSQDDLDQKGMPLTVRTLFVLDPQVRVRLMLMYPASTGRNFVEVLRVLDSLQLTDQKELSTPVNWKQGDRVCITPQVSAAEAAENYPDLLVEKLPSSKNYLRFTKQY